MLCLGRRLSPSAPSSWTLAASFCSGKCPFIIPLIIFSFTLFSPSGTPDSWALHSPDKASSFFFLPLSCFLFAYFVLLSRRMPQLGIPAFPLDIFCKKKTKRKRGALFLILVSFSF